MKSNVKKKCFIEIVNYCADPRSRSLTKCNLCRGIYVFHTEYNDRSVQIFLNLVNSTLSEINRS